MLGPSRKKPLISTSPISSNRGFHDESSPVKGSSLIRADCSEYVNSLNAKKQNFCTSMGLYTACYNNQIPQKCLKHLNFITLYCSDEKKLLCVNCLYGSTTHKDHEVFPSNSKQADIKRQNEQKIRELDAELKQIRDSQSKVNQNKKIIESESNFIMHEITKEFTEMRRMIDAKEKELKDRAIRQFQKAAGENDITRKEVSWWREEMQKMRNGLPRETDEEAEIYKLLVLELMLNEKLEGEKLTYVASKQQMEHEFLNEARELKEVVKAKVQQGARSNQVKLF